MLLGLEAPHRTVLTLYTASVLRHQRFKTHWPLEYPNQWPALVSQTRPTMPVPNRGTRHGRAASENHAHARGDKPTPSRHRTRISYVDPVPSIALTQNTLTERAGQGFHSMPNPLETAATSLSSMPEPQILEELSMEISRGGIPREEKNVVENGRHRLVELAPKMADLTIDEDVRWPSEAGGVPLEDLVRRLLAYSMSRLDFKFKNIFLCFYRMFCTPACLLSLILSQFSQVNDGNEPLLSKVNCSLRYLNVILQWVKSYPGDFAHPSTRHALSIFVSKIASHRAFAAAADELCADLEGIEEDDDSIWGNSDFDNSPEIPMPPIKTDLEHVPISPAESGSPEEISKPRRQDDRDIDYSKRSSHSKSSSTISSSNRTESVPGSSISSPLGSVEALRQGDFFPVFPLAPLTKSQWRRIMEFGAEDIAFELTTIDLKMYSSIKPRDFVRHTCLSTNQRVRYKSLKNVSRMIDHFNHLALLVSNLVLLRNKAKHRAKMLEHVINIARVRKSNPEIVLAGSRRMIEAASAQ